MIIEESRKHDNANKAYCVLGCNAASNLGTEAASAFPEIGEYQFPTNGCWDDGSLYKKKGALRISNSPADLKIYYAI
ncbi:MAG: hypothetical protein HON14_14175 [Rhodospirillaceae bacterium]|nr:hypothetical protein [Rhodospirillaceae bacterium]